MKILSVDAKLNIQLWLGVILSLSGLILLTIGLFIPPMGVIDSSLLVAYGEISTFAGALIGVDYNYKFKMKKIENHETNE